MHIQLISLFESKITYLSRNGSTGPSSSRKNQVSFCSNGLETSPFQVESLKVAIAIEIDKLSNESLQVLGTQPLEQWRNLTSWNCLYENICKIPAKKHKINKGVS